MAEATNPQHRDEGTGDGDASGPLVAYRKGALVAREDTYGRLTGWLGEHPLLSGLIGGSCVVGIAAAAAWEGVSTVPSVAAILSAIVIATWVVLFYFLGSFFAGQGVREVYRSYRFEWEDTTLVWRKDGEVLARLEAPDFSLYAEPGLGDADVGERAPWAIWLVIKGAGGDRVVIKTRVLAGEAKAYPEAGEELQQATDEELPVGVVSPLLQRADRHLGAD